MNKQTQILIFIVLIILYACTEKEEEGYYENGSLKYKVTTIAGKREGVLLKYYEDGTLMMTSNWKDGLKSGVSMEYHHNGQVSAKEYFVDGKPEGILEYYDSLGNLRQELHASNGKLNGKNNIYFESGKLKYSEVYVNDRLEGKAIEYNQNGTVKMRLIYHTDTIVYAIEYLDDGYVTNQLLKFEKTYDPSNTYKVGEKQIMYVKLLYSYYEGSKLRIVLGDTDSLGNVTDTTYSVTSDNLVAKVEYVPKNDGENILKGSASEIANDSVKVIKHIELKFDIKE